MLERDFVKDILSKKPKDGRDDLAFLVARQLSALEAMGVEVPQSDRRTNIREVRAYLAMASHKRSTGALVLTPEQSEAFSTLRELVDFWIERDKFEISCTLCSDCFYFDKGFCVIPKSRVDGGNAPAAIPRFGSPELMEQYYVRQDFTIRAKVCGPNGAWWEKR